MRAQRVVMAVVGLWLFSCGAPRICTPGKSEACIGPGGCSGGQSCNADGTALLVCDCGSATPTDAGMADAGAVDAGHDAGVPDAGLTSCDPTPADGGAPNCPSGQRCTWLTLSPTEGRSVCLPNGTVAANGACTRGADGQTTGFDDCVAGTTCTNGICAATCRLEDRDSCGPIDSCTAYAGLFANEPDAPLTGACTQGCDPLLQRIADGGTCGANKGCYVLTSSTSSVAVCANAGTVMHNQPLPGTSFANSCVPGAMPRNIYGTGMRECGGLCAPDEVTTTNTANEGGIAPNSCQARWGAAAPSDAVAGESCRYYWAREPFETGSRFSNTLGFCFEHAAAQYDSNGDMTPDAPFPRCTTLTTGDVVPPIQNPPGNDALYFYCVTNPATPKLGQKHAPLQPVTLPRLTGWR